MRSPILRTRIESFSDSSFQSHFFPERSLMRLPSGFRSTATGDDAQLESPVFKVVISGRHRDRRLPHGCELVHPYAVQLLSLHRHFRFPSPLHACLTHGKTNFLAPESTNHPQLRRLGVDGSSRTVTWTADYLEGVPQVGRPGRSRRLAWRLSVYIHALGGVPSPYTGQPFTKYVEELQQQYQRLREELGPEASRAARIAGRAAIKKHGLVKAASEFSCSGGSAPDNLRETMDEPKQQDPPKSRQETLNEDGSASEASPRELSNCHRKIRHTNSLSALLHASQLHDEDLRIYPCPLCQGLHVGHDPEPRARERRRIIHELRSLERLLQELERERVRLLARQSELVAERDRTVHKEKTRCEWR
jgi:hypothetical protein